jgi:hypothetical protein
MERMKGNTLLFVPKIYALITFGYTADITDRVINLD